MHISSRDVTFLSDGLAIQGKIEGTGPSGVLLLHPHPAYGGTMDYPLLYHLSRFLATKFTVMRFNFRGVGRSQGSFSGDGRGELRDVRAALNHLCQTTGDNSPHVVGYSFGASAALALATVARTGKIVCFSPSLALLESMAEISSLKTDFPILLYHGSHDDAIPRAEINQLIAKLEPLAEIIFEEVNTDHFYADADLRHSLAERVLKWL
ncbi:MAG: alpha/beta hydrolase [Candidatus Thorarchaeota archaeon]